jgi:hypothetical protein
MGWEVMIRGTGAVPAPVCSVCELPITDAVRASYWWAHERGDTSGARLGVGTRWRADFVHHGACHQQLQETLESQGLTLMMCHLQALPTQLLAAWRMDLPTSAADALLMAGIAPEAEGIRAVLKHLGVQVLPLRTRTRRH